MKQEATEQQVAKGRRTNSTQYARQVVSENLTQLLEDKSTEDAMLNIVAEECSPSLLGRILVHPQASEKTREQVRQRLETVIRETDQDKNYDEVCCGGAGDWPCAGPRPA